jgi:hypothetical protein
MAASPNPFGIGPAPVPTPAPMAQPAAAPANFGMVGAPPGAPAPPPPAPAPSGAQPNRMNEFAGWLTQNVAASTPPTVDGLRDKWYRAQHGDAAVDADMARVAALQASAKASQAGGQHHTFSAPGAAPAGFVTGAAPAPAAAAPGQVPPAPAPGMIGPTGTPMAKSAPAPGTGTISPEQAQQMKTLRFDDANVASSMATVWKMMQENGWSPKQVGEVFGYNEAEITTSLARFGYGTGPSPGVTGAVGPQGQVTDSPMDPRNETIEGRVSELLAADENGNYTHPVVRQAVERQMQAFNARGMRNSSMAMQAAQEAAISKAIEIAGPDAERYFQNRRANVGEGNNLARDDLAHERQQESRQDEQDFQLRRDYQGAVQNVGTNFQRQLDTINASNMTPEDKNIAIAQATQVRDGEIAYLNNVYSRMPRWSAEWGAAAVPSAGIDLSAATNQDMLANIANDPAQPPERREEARRRLEALRSGAASPAPAPAPASGGSAGSGWEWQPSAGS